MVTNTQNNCPYCRSYEIEVGESFSDNDVFIHVNGKTIHTDKLDLGKPLNDEDMMSIQIEVIRNLIVEFTDLGPFGEPISFCPKCGRKLGN